MTYTLYSFLLKFFNYASHICWQSNYIWLSLCFLQSQATSWHQPWTRAHFSDLQKDRLFLPRIWSCFVLWDKVHVRGHAIACSHKDAYTRTGLHTHTGNPDIFAVKIVSCFSKWTQMNEITSIFLLLVKENIVLSSSSFKTFQVRFPDSLYSLYLYRSIWSSLWSRLD